MTEPVLELVDIHAGYGPLAVLHGVSFDLRRDEVVAVLGANGAGKTTSLRIASGTIRPSAGRIKLHGKDVTTTATNQRVASGLVHVPEGRQVFPDLTVEENLLVGGLVKGGRRKLTPRLEFAFDMFPMLAERRSQLGGTLSGGEQQMLAIARGLMSEPNVIMLDEPSLGLAPMAVDTVYETIDRLKKEFGLAVLLVEQHAALATEIADRIVLLQSGTVVAAGDTDSFADDDQFRRAYLGDTT